MVQRETRQNVVWWGWWPAKSDVPHGGVARRLRLLFPHPIIVRIAYGGFPRSVTRQQRQGYPRQPLWRTGRQGRVKVLQKEFPLARHGRGRTGSVPSGQARRQEQGP